MEDLRAQQTLQSGKGIPLTVSFQQQNENKHSINNT